MGEKKKGRKPIEIIESTPYSEIIFLIASGVNYPEAISKARNTDASATIKQLEVLKKKRFLNEPKKEKLLNKTIYSVNWKKLAEEFVSFTINVKSATEKNNLYSKELTKLKKEIQEDNRLLLVLERIISNKNEIEYYTLQNIKTLQDIFVEINNFLLKDIQIGLLSNIFISLEEKLINLNNLLFKDFRLIEEQKYRFITTLFEMFVQTSQQKNQSEIIQESDFKVTKPTENRHKKAGNTNQNTALSSETKQQDNSK